MESVFDRNSNTPYEVGGLNITRFKTLSNITICAVLYVIVCTCTLCRACILSKAAKEAEKQEAKQQSDTLDHSFRCSLLDEHMA